MRRFFIEPADVCGGKIIISDERSLHHMKNVLRLEQGEKMILSDGVKWEYTVSIEVIGSECINCKILDKQAFSSENSYDTVLFQGIPKSNKMDVIIQKTVELGIDRIVPVFMERTIVKGMDRYAKKIERFKHIAEDAAKQARRSEVPTISEACGFSNMISQLEKFDLIVFPYEEEEELTIKEFLRGNQALTAEKKGLKIAVIIGPEGGFSIGEAQSLIREGCTPVRIAKNILRTETAGIATLSMIQYELFL